MSAPVIYTNPTMFLFCFNLTKFTKWPVGKLHIFVVVFFRYQNRFSQNRYGSGSGIRHSLATPDRLHCSRATVGTSVRSIKAASSKRARAWVRALTQHPMMRQGDMSVVKCHDSAITQVVLREVSHFYFSHEGNLQRSQFSALPRRRDVLRGRHSVTPERRGNVLK